MLPVLPSQAEMEMGLYQAFSTFDTTALGFCPRLLLQTPLVFFLQNKYSPLPPSAFVPAPPVAPVSAPAPMPPVHPPPPMDDEPASKKLKSEENLMPEEEFLRRNKVCA